MLEKKRVLWFTGLSGAGKSTLAERVYKHLEKMDFKVVIVDGDKIRSESHINLDFSPQGIIKNNKLVIDLCLEYLHTYECIIVSVIAISISFVLGVIMKNIDFYILHKTRNLPTDSMKNRSIIEPTLNQI